MKVVTSLLLMLLMVSFSVSANENYIPTKNNWLQVEISSYVNGFKEFGTSVVVLGRGISVKIYYNDHTDIDRANRLAERFKVQIPKILEQYSWAKEYSLLVQTVPEL